MTNLEKIIAIIEEMGLNVISENDHFVNDIGMDSTEIADLATSVSTCFGCDISDSRYKEMRVSELIQLVS